MKIARNICFVQNHYYKYTIGGAEVQAHLLAREFVSSGWKVSYLTGDCHRLQAQASDRLSAVENISAA